MYIALLFTLTRPEWNIPYAWLREAQYKFLIKLYFVVNIYRVVNLNSSFVFFAQQTVDRSTKSARRTACCIHAALDWQSEFWQTTQRHIIVLHTLKEWKIVNYRPSEFHCYYFLDSWNLLCKMTFTFWTRTEWSSESHTVRDLYNWLCYIIGVCMFI
jgi:hypothetical protein